VTFLLVYKDMCKAGVAPNAARAVDGWLDYALGGGQQVAPQLQYAPLPEAIKAKAKAKVAGLQCDGKPLTAA
jgi:phosphate transport system substrate-binding protein